jgi:hypothetical protein
MVGDFLFALSTYPIHVMSEWWINGFGYFHDRFSLENYTSDSTDEVNSSEVASSLLASFRQPLNELAHREDSHQMLRNSNGENLPARRVFKGSDQSNEPVASSSRHQIWYPSRSSDSDDDLAPLEADRTLIPIETSHVEQHQTDDWRQYPAFPSAYPPTPIVTKHKLVSTSKAVSRLLYPPIPEESSRQGFQKSLLPPREPLYPSRAGVLSDNYLISGMPPFLTGQLANANDADDSNITDGYENDDDDDFDVTLKTPLEPRGSARSRPHLRLFVSPPSVSVSSGVFSPSRSAALTTVDNGSPLRTDTDSSFSLNIGPSPIIGRKRPFPRTRPLTAKNRVREIGDESSENPVLQQLPNEESDGRHSPDSGPVSHGLRCLASASASDAADDVDSLSVSEYSNAEEMDQERSPPEEKRRKVVRSLQVKAIESSRAVTHKSSGHSSPPQTRGHSRLKVLKNNPLHHSELPAVVPKRKVGRLKATSGAVKSITVEPSKSGDASLSTGSSAPAGRDTSDAAPKMSYRKSRRKK